MSREEFIDLFLTELRDIYSAEKQILKGLPKMRDASASSSLVEAFDHHFKETQHQVERLDRIFKSLKQSNNGETCEAMEGLISEAEEVINRYPKSPTRDAGIIAAAQRIEHYEIAVYGTLRTFAKELDFDEISDLLDETLTEEGNANKKLTKIAEGGLFTAGVNEKAHGRH